MAAPRVVAEQPSGAAPSARGGNATVPRCANGQPSPVADDPEHGGGRGLGGTPSLPHPPESVALCLGAFYVLVPMWLGAPRPACMGGLRWILHGEGPPGFLGRYLVTVL